MEKNRCSILLCIQLVMNEYKNIKFKYKIIIYRDQKLYFKNMFLIILGII